MARNETNDIVGAFLPNVKIQRVVLESTAGGFLPKVDNPHIDTAEERGRILAARVQRADASDGLRATVYMVIKEKITNDLFGTWFNNQDILDNVIVGLWFCRDKELTDLITKSNLVQRNELMDMFGASKRSREDFSLSLKIQRRFGRAYSKGTLEIQSFKLSNFIHRSVDKQNEDVIFSGIKKLSSDGDFIYEFTLKTEFFLHAELEPEHLSVFANARLNPDFLNDFGLEIPTATYGTRSLSTDLPQGVYHIENIIDNKQIKSQKTIFLDAETSEIWLGPVHEDDGLWFTGFAHGLEEDEKLLTMTAVKNTVVQDFRILKRFERLVTDFSFIENKLFNTQNQTKLLSNDNRDIRRVYNFVTDGFFSRDKTASLVFNSGHHLFFGINIVELVKQRAKYALLYGDNLEDLMNNVRISGLNIWRKRIEKPVNRTQIGEHQFKDWDADGQDAKPPHLVVHAAPAPGGDNMFIPFAEHTSVTQGVEKFIGSLEQINFDLENVGPNPSGITHYKVQDVLFSEITDGFYQYGVELNIEDHSWRFVADKLRELTDAYNYLLRYYDESQKVGISRTKLVGSNPHIDHPFERLANDVKIVRNNYDPIANKFTHNFVAWASVADPEDLKNPKLMYVYDARGRRIGRRRVPTRFNRAAQSVSSLMKIIKLFKNAEKLNESPAELMKRSRADAERRFDIQELQDFFNLMVDPEDGNPDGISKILDIMESISIRLEKLIGLTGEGTPDKNSLIGVVRPSRISKAGTGEKRTINIFKWFPKIIDSNVPKSTGYDYHSIRELAAANLRTHSSAVISLEDYRERTKRESLKYYRPNDADESIFGTSITLNGRGGTNYLKRTATIADSAFSYLTPGSISIKGDITHRIIQRHTTSLYDDEIYNELLVKIIRHNFVETTSGDPYGAPPLGGFSINQRLEDIKGISTQEQRIKFILQKLLADMNVTVVEKITEGTALSEQGVEEVFLIEKVDELMQAGNIGEAEKLERVLNDLRNARLGNNELSRPNKIFMRMINSFKDTGTVFDLSSENNIIDNSNVDNVARSGKVDLLPNQLKSLFDQNHLKIRRVWNFGVNFDPNTGEETKIDLMNIPKNIGSLVFNYKLVKQIEVLTGYERSHTGNAIEPELPSRPKFELLTRDRFTDFQFDENKQAIFCRIANYSNNDFPDLNKFIAESKYELPIFNEYFVISKNARSIDIEIIGAEE